MDMKKNIIILFITGILIIVLGLTIMEFRNAKEGHKVTTITKSMLLNQLEISDLSTVSYNYNAIASVYNSKHTTLKYHVAYQGIVNAGIDFSKIDIKIYNQKHLIYITLPQIAIHDVEVDPGSLDYIFEDNRYETETVSQEGYKSSLSDLKKRAKKDKKIYAMAKENAISTVDAWITPWVQQVYPEYAVKIK